MMPQNSADPQFAKIGIREKIAYGMGDVACNVVFALTTSLLLYFYTNVIHVNVRTVGAILLISRVFDGVSDLVIGVLVDRTHSKHGKARVWILWMMIPYGISAVLLFLVPCGSEWAKEVYIFITYNFCTTVVYTALNLPYATLATLMTRDTNERAIVNLFRTGMSTLGNMVITSVTFPLVAFLGDTQRAWITVSALYAVIAVGMLWFCFCNCRERIPLETKTTDGQAVGLWMGLRLVTKNRYFIVFFLLAIFLAFYEAVTGACSAYYAQYVLGNRNLTGLLSAFEAVPQILVLFIIAPFIPRLGKRNIALCGAVIAVLGMAAQFLSPGSLPLVLFACALRGIGKGCFRGVKYSMLADIIEYGQWKTGVRLQGFLVSAMTAGQKFGNGVMIALVGGLLDFAGFAGTVAISAHASVMIERIYIFGNLIAWALIGFTLLWYRLDRQYPEILAQLIAREHEKF